MRSRFTVLAAIVCGLGALVVPVAGAAPRHDKGLTIAAAPNPIIAGEGVLISGQLTGPDNAGQTIRLYHRLAGTPSFTLIGATTTNSDGQYEFTRVEGVVLTNRNWYVRGPSDTHSRTIHEHVAALVSLVPSSSTGLSGQRLVFTGAITPVHPDERVLLQEQDGLNGNGWRTIASTFTGPGSHFDFSHVWSRPGDYTIRAYFPGDPRNVAGASDPASVQIQQKENPTFTLTSSQPILPEGKSVTLSGYLYKTGTTTPEGLTEVTLYGQTVGQPFNAIATIATASNGSYSFTESPVNNTVYKVETTLAPHRSTAVLYEGVQDELTITDSSSTATDGGSVTISGTVSPDKTGHVIYLQKQGADGFWHNVASETVAAGSTYSFTHTFGEMGTMTFRARIPGGPDNVGNASAPVTITVSGVAPIPPTPES